MDGEAPFFRSRSVPLERRAIPVSEPAKAGADRCVDLQSDLFRLDNSWFQPLRRSPIVHGRDGFRLDPREKIRARRSEPCALAEPVLVVLERKSRAAHVPACTEHGYIRREKSFVFRYIRERGPSQVVVESAQLLHLRDNLFPVRRRHPGAEIPDRNLRPLVSDRCRGETQRRIGRIRIDRRRVRHFHRGDGR